MNYKLCRGDVLTIGFDDRVTKHKDTDLCTHPHDQRRPTTKHRLFLLLMLLLLSTTLFAQRMIHAPRLHEQFGLSQDMTIVDVCDTMGLSLSDFKEAFHLEKSNPNTENLPLASLSISLDAIYQYYCRKNFGFDDSATITEVCLILQIPFTKMASYLALNPQLAESRTRTIRETYLEALDIYELSDRFKSESTDFTATLTVLGISVVFLALFLISFVISQFVMFVRKQKDTKLAAAITPIGKVLTKKPEDLSSDAVIAVIAAIHKHKMASLAEYHIMLTWRRANANISMWKASSKTELPTINYNLLKKRR